MEPPNVSTDERRSSPRVIPIQVQERPEHGSSLPQNPRQKTQTRHGENYFCWEAVGVQQQVII
eukprot:6258440-Pyramimonas_sp.AAC.1